MYQPLRRVSLFATLLGLSAPPPALAGQDTVSPAGRPYGAFTFKDSVLVQATQGEAFDRFLEVDAWWDHRFSENPARFYIEARPGGAFQEIFDDSGDGVLHATVIYVKQREILRMRGPLGLSGYALDMVFTLTFQGGSSGTWVRLEARGAGELEEGWPRAVQNVWRHFLHQRFKPYVEGALG